MRAILLLVVSLMLAVAIGCVEDAALSGYTAPPAAGRPGGVSLEPLSIPPPPRTAPVSDMSAPAVVYAPPARSVSPDSPYAALYGGYAVAPAQPGPPPMAFAEPSPAGSYPAAPGAIVSAPGPAGTVAPGVTAYISEPYVLPESAPSYPSAILARGPDVTYDATSFPMASAPAPVYVDPSFPVAVAMHPLPAAGGPVVSAPIASVPASAPAPIAAPLVAAAAGDAASYRLVPAPDIQPGIHPGDAAPSQWFEVIRPGNGPIRIGRMSSTCVCVSPRIPTRYINAGERALIECRLVDRPDVNNVTYGLYVTILEPVRTTLDADITVSF